VENFFGGGGGGFIIKLMQFFGLRDKGKDNNFFGAHRPPESIAIYINETLTMAPNIEIIFCFESINRCDEIHRNYMFALSLRIRSFYTKFPV
jgi:hypothetical protein